MREVHSGRETWSGFSPRRSDSGAKSQRLRRPEQRLHPVRNVPAAWCRFVISACSLDWMLCEFSPIGKTPARLPRHVWLPGRARGMECAAAAAWKVMCFQPRSPQMDVGTSARAGRIFCSGGSGPAVGDLLVEAGGK